MWLTCYNNISDGRRVSQTNYDFIRFLVNAWLSGSFIQADVESSIITSVQERN